MSRRARAGPFSLEGPWPEPAPCAWWSVYRLYDADLALLYVGSAVFPGDRLDEHCRQATPFLPYARLWTYQWYTSPIEARRAEQGLIDELAPAFNNERGQRRTTPGYRRRARPRRSLELISHPVGTRPADQIVVVDDEPVRAARVGVDLPWQTWRELFMADLDDGVKIGPRIRMMVQCWRHHPRMRQQVDVVARSRALDHRPEQRRAGISLHPRHRAELTAAARSQGLRLSALVAGMAALWCTDPDVRDHIDSTARRFHRHLPS